MPAFFAGALRLDGTLLLLGVGGAIEVGGAIPTAVVISAPGGIAPGGIVPGAADDTPLGGTVPGTAKPGITALCAPDIA